MTDNQHEIIIKGSDRFAGTGHNSEIVEDKNGRTWILYHAVDIAKPKGRVLMLDEVKWQDNWPFIDGSIPSLSSVKPAL